MPEKVNKITSVGEDEQKLGPLGPVNGNVKWSSHCGKQYGSSSKLKTELPYESRIPLLNIYPREIKSRISKRNHTPMFIAALQQPKGGGNTRAHWWMDAWAKRGLYVQWNYYSPLKRKAVPTHARTWMNLEGILLSEIRQSQRSNIVWFCL